MNAMLSGFIISSRKNAPAAEGSNSQGLVFVFGMTQLFCGSKKGVQINVK
jgi:hypothetical protein